jgi:hypothetical protein
MRRSTRSRATALAVAGLLLATLAPAQAAPVSKSYTAGFISDTTPVLCDNDPGNPTGQNIGAVCFNVSPGDRFQITAEDLLVDPVGFFWAFMDQHWNTTFGRPGPDPVNELTAPCTLCGFICAPITLTAPPGSVRIRVAPFGPIIGALECSAHGSPGFGTTGVITKTAA